MPTTIEECRELKEWAEAQPVRAEPAATIEQIGKHVRYLDAALPSKAVDEDTGKMRTAVYLKLLSPYSNEALAFMSLRACQTLDWFPTPKQCLDILSDYRAPPTDRQIALTYCHQFTQARFEAWLASVMDGTVTDEAVAAVPDQWRRIAVERTGLRRMPDGEYVVRNRVADDEA